LSTSVSRAFIFTLIITIFCFAAPVILAQNGQEGEIAETEEELVINPLIAAEREIIFPEGTSTATPVTGSTTMNILRILLTLAVVAAAIYGLVFFVKKFNRNKTSKDPYLKILASTALGANRSACILSVGTQAWLVGFSEHSVGLISEIQDKDILDIMLLEEAKKSSEEPEKITDLKSFIRRLGIQTESGVPGPDNIRKRRERLKDL